MTFASQLAPATTVFACARCGRAFSEEDFGDIGLRQPEPDEDRDAYFDDQLLDELSHLACSAADGDA